MITREEFRTIANNGIWKQNTSIVQILGLCPLLAVTTNAVNGIMLSLATILVMAISNVAVASLRNFIPHEIRIPVFILIVAALVTVVDLLFNANLHELYLVLGIFIPLIVTNCIVLARVEAFAAKNPPLQSTFDGIFMGVGMLWTLALLGAMRELLGSGTLFGGIDMVFPDLQPIQLAAGKLPRLPAGHAAARRLHPARLHDRLEKLAGCPRRRPRPAQAAAAGGHGWRPLAPPTHRHASEQQGQGLLPGLARCRPCHEKSGKASMAHAPCRIIFCSI